jgi:hypothetical protein
LKPASILRFQTLFFFYHLLRRIGYSDRNLWKRKRNFILFGGKFLKWSREWPGPFKEERMDVNDRGKSSRVEVLAKGWGGSLQLQGE